MISTEIMGTFINRGNCEFSDIVNGKNGACPPTRIGLIHPLLNRKLSAN